ncbi:Uncharacterized membrane protein [Alkalithermobacter thermoalcaliphilus JW-YL-7 = DSM 7308]|uniref:Uncharacterized membrane protein n=1 Tax=Alkalithermobacter thermoalcaliphilus JW-YL-7 = DSM 7308 TaxID=1121328 RepID=A0A150FRV4_CLOPD|nr:YibE/F family protein [[Clostridium] paradoxum JW-YL-7 = DSM 7308]SHK61721.1 Uncharacterized membrane protein [[Clostridium] paradoxum JW-YL-7 = DSM 7308]
MKKIVFIFLLIILTSLTSYAHSNIYKAVVLDVEVVESQKDDIFITSQNVKVKIINGKYKNTTIEVKNNFSGNPAYDINVEKGDKVLIDINEDENGNIQAYITDYARDEYIYYLTLVFILLLVFIGRFKGIKTIITLFITIGCIYKILLPFILKGYNPIFVTILTSYVIVVLTITIISGISKKSLSAILGTLLGIMVAGFISYYVGTKIKLTGLSSEEAMMLAYVKEYFDFRGLLFAGILLGALGAIMDVSMSIASSIEEISNANKKLTSYELFSAGMNVGKDIMGTMANTLILAYTGSSIPLLILFMAYNTSFVKVINLDVIATEIVRALSGSIGLILTIPITAGIAAYLSKLNKNT